MKRFSPPSFFLSQLHQLFIVFVVFNDIVNHCKMAQVESEHCETNQAGIFTLTVFRLQSHKFKAMINWGLNWRLKNLFTRRDIFNVWREWATFIIYLLLEGRKVINFKEILACKVKDEKYFSWNQQQLIRT